MALVPVAGFDGSSTEESFRALMLASGLTWSFGADSASMRPTIGGAGDRSVTVAVGGASYAGNFVQNTAPIVMNHDPVASGSRWDLVVLRRNYSTNSPTLHIITGSTTRALPSFQKTYPVVDQPVYLARIQAGSTGVQELVDLRIHHSNGGALAYDTLALSYLTQLGSRITIDGATWSYEIRGGTAQWVQSRSALQPVSMFALGGTLAGGTVPPGAPIYMQAGTTVGRTDSSGYSRVTFPTPFPNGLISIVLTNGDSNVDRSLGEVLTMSVAGTPWHNGQRDSVVYAVLRPRHSTPHLQTANILHRVNWVALGW